MLPFTREQFFTVFLEYNNAVWPASILAHGLALIALIAVLWPKPFWSRVTASFLAIMWAWTGLAYHGIFFSSINSAAFLFGALFVAQALLFFHFGVFNDRLQFSETQGPRAIMGWTFISYALIAYPLMGIAGGHAYETLPQFGITPCPVTLFTFGILLFAKSPLPWVLLVIPVIWSLIGGTAAIFLAVPQDWLLLASGVITAVLLVFPKSNPGQSAAKPADLGEK
ncbi:MAG: DUF6064 family protein [Aestuariivirga sp.]|nr:DUF6064 family protein [Aestuariivirga sp.]